MRQLAVYAAIFVVVAGLTWPGSPAGKALVSVTAGLSGVLRSGASTVTGGTPA
jgi:hypothetical protein